MWFKSLFIILACKILYWLTVFRVAYTGFRNSFIDCILYEMIFWPNKSYPIIPSSEVCSFIYSLGLIIWYQIYILTLGSWFSHGQDFGLKRDCIDKENRAMFFGWFCQKSSLLEALMWFFHIYILLGIPKRRWNLQVWLVQPQLVSHNLFNWAADVCMLKKIRLLQLFLVPFPTVRCLVYLQPHHLKL